MSMRFLITGGTGFIGQHLVKSLTKDGHQVTILSRSDRDSNDRYVSYRKWDGKSMPLAIGLYDVVVNLAGANIGDMKWTKENKELFIKSRVDATRACVNYINSCQRRPKAFISSSAIGYYGGQSEEELTEESAAGTDFVASICKSWEAAAEGAKCRTVKLRISVVLGKEGGPLPQMLTPYRFCLGGRMGSGKQAFSWIHIADLLQAIHLCINNPMIEGPINMASPKWLTQQAFSNELGRAVRRPDLMIIPAFALKFLFGEKATLFLDGQKIVPQKLLDLDFQFKFGHLPDALENLIG